LIFFLIVELVSFGQALNDPTKFDQKRNFHLTKNEFLNQFGNNDTSIAIIDMFFKKRRNAILKISILPIPVMAGKIGTAIDERYSHGDVVVPIVGMSSFVISVCIVLPIMGTGIYQLLYFTRKKLIRILDDYEKGKPIPYDIIKRVKFGQQKSNKYIDDIYW